MDFDAKDVGRWIGHQLLIGAIGFAKGTGRAARNVAILLLRWALWAIAAAIVVSPMFVLGVWGIPVSVLLAIAFKFAYAVGGAVLRGYLNR